METYPEPADVTIMGRYAIALAGERKVHLVGANAVRGGLNGRAVVQAVCCHLGWGPVRSPPPGWPVCDECGEITS